MEEEKYQDQTDIAWSNPVYFANDHDKGRLHANNVLFYFAESPFFDRSSENHTLFIQYIGTESQHAILGDRKKFEANLKKRRGLSYVVTHDPLEPLNQTVPGPEGPISANVWVIRKQFRETPSDDSSTTALAYYYISNMVIYEAPTVAKILSTRMLSVANAIGSIFSEASQLPLFSVAHGRTYVKPVQKAITQKDAGTTQQSKEATPMPGHEGAATEKINQSADAEKAQENSDSRTLYQALQMTMRYGKEYSDEFPLVGEPGRFRFSNAKEQAPKTVGAVQQASSQTSGSRAATPAASRAASMVPGGR